MSNLLNERSRLFDLMNLIHENAVNKKFWDIPRIKLKNLLIITELSEHIEAWCKNKVANKEEYYNGLEELKEDFNAAIFMLHIKDSMEDEIADAIIRLLDLMAGLNMNKPRYYSQMKYYHITVRTEDREDWLYYIMKLVLDRKYWQALKHLFIYCEKFNIDIEWHIEHKMNYNATRESLHGKKIG